MNITRVTVKVLDKIKAVSWLLERGYELDTSNIEEFFSYEGSLGCPYVIVKEKQVESKPLDMEKVYEGLIKEMRTIINNHA